MRRRLHSMGAVVAVALALAAALGTAWGQTVVWAVTQMSPVSIVEMHSGDTRAVTLKL